MINLLPPTRLNNLRLARSNTILRRYLELIFVSMVILTAVLMGSYYFLRSDQQSTQNVLDIEAARIAELEPYQKQAQDLSQLVNTIAGLSSRDVKFSSMLTQLGQLMPSGAALTGLQLSADDLEAPLVISAQVDAEDRAAILRNNIASSPLFSRADMQSIKAIEEKDTPAASTNADDPEASGSTPQPPSAPVSPYRYTVTISAYLKKVTEGTR